LQTQEAVNLFLKSRTARGLSKQTIRWYKGILYFFAAQYPTLPLIPDYIEDFLASCQAGDERRHGYYRTVRCLYRFLHYRLDIPNPVEKVAPPKVRLKCPRVLMPDEIDQLLSYPHAPKIKAALLFLLDTGARLGELRNLTADHFTETPWGYVAIVNGKTGFRYIPVSNETYRTLLKYLPFKYSRSWLCRLISRAFRDAYVEGTAHTLRHTFATLWEGDETVLQQIMGHTHISTTMLYRHLRTRTLSAQHREHSPLRMVLSASKSML